MKLEARQKLPSNRTFGLFFSVVFIIIYSWLFFKYQNNQIWLIVLGLVFLLLGLLNSKLLHYPNLMWIKLGYILGLIISPIIMAIIFFLVITPINILMKIFQKDIIGLKKNKFSYWSKRRENNKNMRNQF